MFIKNSFGQFDKTDKELLQKQQEEIAKFDLDLDEIVDYVLSYESEFEDAVDVSRVLKYLTNFEQIKTIVNYQSGEMFYELGTFSEEFYERLYQATKSKDTKKYIFSWLPTKLQTEDRLLNYFESNRDASFGNYKGKKPSIKILKKIFEYNLASFRSMNKKWITPRLKDYIVDKDGYGLCLMPESLITKDEILDYFLTISKDKSRVANGFYSELPEKFKSDIDIQVQFVVRFSFKTITVDLLNHVDDVFWKKFVEKKQPSIFDHGIMDWFEKTSTNKRFYQKLLSIVPGDFIVRRNKLSDEELLTVLDAFVVNKARPMRYDKIIEELESRGMLTKEIIEKARIKAYDLRLIFTKKQLKKILTSEIIDVLFEQGDETLFNDLKFMQNNVEMTMSRLIKIIDKSTLDPRQIIVRLTMVFTEAECVEFYFEFRNNKRVGSLIAKLLKSSYFVNLVKVKEEIDKSYNENSTIEDWNRMRELFIM